MAMKRTTVFADESDLAILKVAAARRGVPEAELLRDAIHLAALSHQTWSTPFFGHTYPPDPDTRVPASDALATIWDEHADAYERTKNPAP